MLRHLAQIAAKKIPGLSEKVGTILGAGASPGSYVVRVEGKTYNQVWSVNLLFYPVGSQVKIIMDRTTPTIVP